MATATAEDETQTQQKTSVRVGVQKFGTFLSNMVMPNIGAFIAWGFITALFIEVGWIAEIAKRIGYSGDLDWVQRLGGWGIDPDSCTSAVTGPTGAEIALQDGGQACSSYGGIVGPMITYLLPLLIAYTGGKIVYDVRGGVVGAIAAMGVITGTAIPMFMGAMIMGPLGGWSMKRLDALWHHKIRPGFEMLVNNFAAGIWGMILAIFGFFAMSPIVSWISTVLGNAVEWLVNNNALPLTSILIEPAKVLFLNNAINHGVLTPLGINQVAENGKSVLFLLEANPGPGLGILLAYMFFGTGIAKASAPGAAIIHFFGGIHEIYFPYVLMKPILILAAIAGGMTGVFINVLFGVGLRAPAAPGSIIAVYAQTASDSFIGVTLAVIGAAAVSFLVASFFLRISKDDDGDLSAATASMEEMKGKKSTAAASLAGTGEAAAHGPIKHIVFACDAGMGSSAMGASVLRKKIHGAGFEDVSVVNKAISSLTDEFDLVVSHQDLTPRAKQKTGSAIQVSVDNFMGSPRYDEIVELIERTNAEDADGGAAPAGGDVATGGGDVATGGGESPVNTPAGAAAGGAGSGAATGAAGTAVLDRENGQAKQDAGSQDTQASVLSDESIVLAGNAKDKAGAISEAGRLLVAGGAVQEAYVDSMHERESSVSTYMGNMLAIPHGTNEAKPMIQHSAISFVRYADPIDWNGKEVKFVLGIAGQGDDHMALLGKIAEVFLDKDQVAQLEAADSKQSISRILGNVG